MIAERFILDVRSARMRCNMNELQCQMRFIPVSFDPNPFLKHARRDGIKP